ncbi:MAG: 1,4-dihydroxy-2-naphthoate octaprenyltransferase [Planctomycetota bacterium]|nr:MAG: 1,4-dihydroxy-2-naphthoate octaprenyltransferase [Planctomycetota bacterium]
MRAVALRAWWSAARPRTLFVGLAAVSLGIAAAGGEGAFDPLRAGVIVLTALLLQIGVNFANDLSDFVRGVDGPERCGPPRACQQGLVTPRAMAGATAAVLLGASASGLALVLWGGWPYAVLGAASVAAAVLYTGGPRPLGYLGLGDLLVLVFFGPVAVGGSFALLRGRWSGETIAAGIAVGLLAAAVLHANNMRDMAGDRRAGKRTLAVRLGLRGARIYFALLVLAPFGIVVSLARAWGADLLPLVLLPWALVWVRRVATAVPPGEPGGSRQEAAVFDGALAAVARLLVVFVLTWLPRWLG